MASILVGNEVVKAVDGTLHVVMVVVRLRKGILLAPIISNVLDAESKKETLAAALQIFGVVVESKANKLMEQNSENCIKVSFLTFI